MDNNPSPPYDLSLKVLGNPVIPVLLLQFAAEHEGDMAEAKLARQIPRYIGRKLNSTERFDARFLSFRDTRDARTFFINTTKLPDREALEEIAEFHKIRYVLYGKIGIGERIRLEVHLYDVRTKQALFRKGFETYAAYTFDAFDEVCMGTAQAAGVELGRDDRIALFSRDTLLWEPFLYYLLAEDDRYGMAVGVPPPDIGMTVDAFIESLKMDPDFLLAELSVTETVFEAMDSGLITPERARELLERVVAVLPSSVSTHYALLLLAARNRDAARAQTHAGALALLRPGDGELQGEVAETLERIRS